MIVLCQAFIINHDSHRTIPVNILMLQFMSNKNKNKYIYPTMHQSHRTVK